MKNLLVIAVTILAVGCNIVNLKDMPFPLEERGGITYRQGSDTRYTGKAVSYYQNEQKCKEINYKDGKREGLFLRWYKDGSKQFVINYKDGKEDGLRLKWHENGQKSEESYSKDGVFISGTYWHYDGEEWDPYEFFLTD